MPELSSSVPLFPEFERFVIEHDLIGKVRGAQSAKLPRILGQGQTKAVGLDLPPAPIERKMELIKFEIPSDVAPPRSLLDERERVRAEVDAELAVLRKTEGVRRLASTVLRGLATPSGVKDNHFFSGRLVLVPDKQGTEWSWSLTPHYPLISKIPPDVDYLIRAHVLGERMLEEILLPLDLFENRLELSWLMARHFSTKDDVFVLDVARMYKVAGQDERFWKIPQKKFFVDLPEAAFVANLIHWRHQRGKAGCGFEFVPATLHQAHPPGAKVFWMPVNPEGTEVRPIIYMRRQLG